ncbi:hypothetical protein OG948_33560 [Embleya sp. NBC_00888]|uniref:hypothetical protein n=1 Tax=Embleya sp. NBC_00888 TaxID=2975960 RepID=UPI00386CE6C0|nr:hypothetical protein OG948_33560 [Embleya sp. NBC_00888]
MGQAPSSGGGSRGGRPWSGQLKGDCEEINDLVHLLRGWLLEPGRGRDRITGKELHLALVPEDFADGVVPNRHKVFEQMSGLGLTLELVEAVVRMCSDDCGTLEGRRVRARQLWNAARTRPTPLAAGRAPAVSESMVRELLAGRDRELAAGNEITRLTNALHDSRDAGDRATTVIRLMALLMSRMRTQIDDLTRERDALLAAERPDPARLEDLRRLAERAEGHRMEAVAQCERAERERAKAQTVADGLIRRIDSLQDELARVRSAATDATRPRDDDRSADEDRSRASDVVEFLDDAEAALDRGKRILDEGRDAVDAAREQLGPPTHSDTHVVVQGEVVGLSRTTPDNPSTGHGTAPLEPRASGGAAPGPGPAGSDPPFWFFVPSARAVWDPVTGIRTRTLLPEVWYLAVSRHRKGLLVAMDGDRTRHVLADIGGIGLGVTPRTTRPTNTRSPVEDRAPGVDRAEVVASGPAASDPPFWFFVRSAQAVWDPAAGSRTRTLLPGVWYLAVSRHRKGLIVEMEGTWHVLAETVRIQPADVDRVEGVLRNKPPSTRSQVASDPPFWFAVPSTRPVSDPVTRAETRTLTAGTWYLAVSRHKSGLIVEVDQARHLLPDISGIQCVPPASNPPRAGRTSPA